MPVRWPRRPAAVSEAVVADAEPDLSCAGELEQPLKALIGKVCRPPVGRSVAWSVARSVLVELSISCGGVLCLGSSAAAGALGFPAPGYWILWASRLCSRLVFCHGRCMCVPVGTTPSSSCASLLVSRSLRLSRLGSRVGLQSPVARRGCSLLSRACRLGSRCAVRCFRCLWVWGVLVAIIKLVGFLVGLRFGASPSGFAFGLRLRASPSGFAFGPARTHESTQNPWAMPGVVPGFPTKHPRHTAVVFAAEHRRAAFWRVSCAICCACWLTSGPKSADRRRHLGSNLKELRAGI